MGDGAHQEASCPRPRTHDSCGSILGGPTLTPRLSAEPMPSNHLSVVMVTIFCFIEGCAVDPRLPTAAVSGLERHCGPAPGLRALPLPTRTLASRPDDEFRRDQPASISARFSPQPLEIADIIGIRSLLTRIPTLEAEAAEHREGARLDLLEVRQHLSTRILLAFLDVARTASEADCEEERADQLADRLQEVRDKRIRRQTLIAIVGDAR